MPVPVLEPTMAMVLAMVPAAMAAAARRLCCKTPVPRSTRTMAVACRQVARRRDDGRLVQNRGRLAITMVMMMMCG